MFKKLINIQTKLKAPKGQFNKFGGYKYRSLEDILEALKPLLAKEECYLVIKDDVVQIGDRYYIKATAILVNSDGNIIAENQALAREPQSKKGMDEAQLSGATSSYARKYALNGLFAIDDTKDADTDEYTAPNAIVSQEQVMEIEKLIADTKSDKAKFMQVFRIAKIEELTQDKYIKAKNMLLAKIKGKK